MFIRRCLPIALHLLNNCLPTLQVDITLKWSPKIIYGVAGAGNPVSATCPNIAPGDCCKPHEHVILPPPKTLQDYAFSHVSFTSLRAQQLGAGFAATSPHYEGIACAGAPLVRFFGWSDGEQQQYHPDMGLAPAPDTLVFAASWIDLRTRFPPDSAGSRYLQWQGVSNALWGSGTWSAASDGVPFPRRRKRDRKHHQRLNGWAEKGQVTIATPSRWSYPSLYEVNGTEFRDKGNGVFKSGDGRVLSLTTGEVG